MNLRISHDLKLPLELVTESVGILAVKRAGKSHTAKRIVEELHAAKQQVVVVDPKGDWWGLRSSADGKGPGIPIVILGGEHGDVPLEPGAGELVAKMVVEQRVSVLLDLAELRKHQVATFMTAFLETLYRLKAKEQYRTPMMLVMDEADAIAPQRPQKGEERMLGAAEDIVRRGGQRGIGIMLVTQRAAVLNKNVLTQVGVLILLRTTGSQDIDAVDEWIKKHDQQEKREKVMSSIAALPRGSAWVWAPGWPDERGIFRRVEVGPLETFDSGATPKPGQQRVLPKTVADVDLDAFRKEMAATIEKAKAEDPKELRRRIAALEGELRKKGTNNIPTPVPKRVEVSVLKADQVQRLEAAANKLDRVGAKAEAGFGALVDRTLAAFEGLHDLAAGLRDAIAGARREGSSEVGVMGWAEPASRVGNPQHRVVDSQRPVARHATAPRDRELSSDLPKGEQLCLAAIAQHQDGVTRPQLTVLTGYKTSTRNSYIQRLKERGLLNFSGEFILASQEGIDALGNDYEPLPTGKELQAYWLKRLPEGESKTLRVLIEKYPDSVDRDTIGEMTGYKTSTRNSYLQRLTTRALVVSVERGRVRAGEHLF